ncbi:egg cell-secreted protein 1.4-like [Populus alba x Populus x berolinensis]|nr:egg cell-secreted protein 1.4-like [Populus alba x Populus x berolinensis]
MSTQTIAILLGFLFMGTLIPSGLAQNIPTLPCFLPLTIIQGCSKEIFVAISGGTGRIGPACCKVINELSDVCWPRLFPSMPATGKFLRGICSRSGISPAPAPAPTSR